jgi:hypothetical protein
MSTAIPEIAISLPKQKGKLRIRWYKLTSEYDTGYWLNALSRRNPPPLAIIGGNTTESASDQARRLHRAVEDLEEAKRPLLLLTTATADRVPSHRPDAAGKSDSLVDLYPGRTFRFCFSNRQIAEAVTHFIWSRDDLRPDSFPAYTTVWQDDPYSADLTQGFLHALKPFLARSTAVAIVSDLALHGGFASCGGLPNIGLHAENQQTFEAVTPGSSSIRWSVGSFDRPNRYEAEAALDILDNSAPYARQRRALLVLSGQSSPCRRLVRAMCRLSPLRTRRFVLACGDAISFNTIVRDRNVAWPIQDLPASLVMFCHNNPVGEVVANGCRDTASGTEDLYLYRDILDALILGSVIDGKLCDTASQLRDGLRGLRVADGKVTRESRGARLFDDSGDRRGGTGEHIVWLRPYFVNERVLPKDRITVAVWSPSLGTWVNRGEPFDILYTGASDQ